LQYVSIDRTWSSGDTVALNLPMQLGVRRWTQNGNSASVDYGPLSFSLRIGEKYVQYAGSKEWPQRGVYATTPWNYALVLNDADPTLSFQVVHKAGPVAAQPFTADAVPIEIHARGRQLAEWTMDHNSLLRPLQASPVKTDAPVEAITLIPMGAARLRISEFPVVGSGDDAHQWIAPATVRGPAVTATPSASYCNAGDTVTAINSGESPASSDDESIPRQTFWDHHGTSEWVQYDFKKPIDVSSVAVYWFDDSGHGGCRIPQSWTLLYRDGQNWKPVDAPSSYDVNKDAFNKTTFSQVKTDALRINVQLKPDSSGGVLQWQVNP
jgi:hypothetical protein